MNTVNDPTEMIPRVVYDRGEIERLRWFQLERYCSAGLVKSIPARLAFDPFDSQSTYFGVYKGDDIVATARIVQADAPEILRYHDLHPETLARLQRHRDCVAEVSRLAVSQDSEPYRALRLLSREFLRFGAQSAEGLLLLASVERPLVRILDRLLGVPVDVVGPSLAQYGDYPGETVPILIDTINCIEVFSANTERQSSFFMEDLKLDVREPQFRRSDIPYAEAFFCASV